MRALLLVRRGAPLTRSLVHTLRQQGFEPFVLSSLPADGGIAFREMCARIEVECAVSADVALSLEEVTKVAGEIEDCAFCLTMADSQRPLMAEANQLLGAPDVTPAALQGALDKYLMRTTLGGLGLSRLQSLRVDDPELRTRLAAGETFVVKPRRGVASLCVGLVRTWDGVEELRTAFEEGPGERDMMAEYFAGNELIAESFFDGRELSLEIVRQDGHDRLVVDHEKTVLEFGAGTVLERGLASPVAGLTDAELATARELADAVLDALGLTDGCYHVELRVNGEGVAEIVEINPRVGGGLIWNSIRAQYDRSITEDWIAVLARREVPAPIERRCGTYMQLAYPGEQRQILGVDHDTSMPEPAVYEETASPGDTPIAHREFFGAGMLWTTSLATHREEVAALAPREYCTFRYVPGLSGRPVLLVLEPDYPTLVAAVATEGVDVVVCHQDPVAPSPEYRAIRDGLALLVRVPAWSATEACVALARQACEGARVQDILAPHAVTREVEAQLRADAGLVTTPVS